MVPILNIAIRAARQFNEYVNLTVDKREQSTPDAKADLRMVDHLDETLFTSLMDSIKKGYPTHYFAAPGEQLTTEKPDAWFMSGFDNTVHLLRKLPDTVYSFVHKKSGKTEHAVIANPYTDAEYVAAKGRGATYNDRRMRVTSCRSLDSAYIATDAFNQVSQSDNSDTYKALCDDLSTSGAQLRVSGCTTLDLAMVAAGQLDAAILTNVNVSDLDAALLICQEAGALVGDLQSGMLNNNSKTLVVANPKLFKTILQSFSAYGKKISAGE